ncbi:MAG: glycosyltransferase family 4 protein [Burkholderiales bacterium]|nr:glycosyltransferase family 4 protein [Bacteroidia bacterium]
MKFLFLYTEIAEYFLACCKELAKDGEVHIVRWPVNKEAPFQFHVGEQINIYSKSNYNQDQLKQLVETINPDVIICSGWIDKDYLKITKKYFRKIPTVMTCDTHWNGSLKQRLAMVASRFTLLNIFSQAWVPGQAQKQYVLNLGFKENNIETGFYSCDLDHFASIYQNQKTQKEILFPKRFIYVGRYYEFKGIMELWQAFIELQAEQPNEWELWCLGVGDIEPVQHPKIKHFGFVQPKDLATYTAQTGVFILPSRFEPWGVVVHEFAASGFPLLLSDKVGSAEQFLHEEKNGFTFKSENVKEIRQALKNLINMKDADLLAMSNYSHHLSKTISPKSWVDSLMKMAK